MKFLIALLIIQLVHVGCSNQVGENNIEKEKKCFDYPSVIDSLRVKDLYDSARWYVYAWHCDKNYITGTDAVKPLTFGELPLSFESVNIRQDTLEINFDFFHKNQQIIPSMIRSVTSVTTGVGFSLSNRSKIYMISPDGYTITEKGGNNRYENPLQPEVVKYINSNRNKLDPCFRYLVEKMKIGN